MWETVKWWERLVTEISGHFFTSRIMGKKHNIRKIVGHDREKRHYQRLSETPGIIAKLNTWTIRRMVSSGMEEGSGMKMREVLGCNYFRQRESSFSCLPRTRDEYIGCYPLLELWGQSFGRFTWVGVVCSPRKQSARRERHLVGLPNDFLVENEMALNTKYWRTRARVSEQGEQTESRRHSLWTLVDHVGAEPYRVFSAGVPPHPQR